MADRAELFSLSTFHSLSPPGCRSAQDISLEEFDDEDLSEITDDCGIGLNYDSDPYEKDCPFLEKNGVHQPIFSFQDDFQEFEMIDDDDEDEEEEDEEEEEEADLDSLPPSPTSGTLQNGRPTTLTLTSNISEDSLNNNSGFLPQKASWQDSLHNPASQGCLSPTHSCHEDGTRVNGKCQDALGTGCPSTPLKPSGDCGPVRSPFRPLLYDSEGNRRERPEYGSFGQHRTQSGSDTDGPVHPSVPAGVARGPSKEGWASAAPAGSHSGTPLTDDELDKSLDADSVCRGSAELVCEEDEGSSYVRFPPIEPCEPGSFTGSTTSSTSSRANTHGRPSSGSDVTDSASSDPGIADMNGKSRRGGHAWSDSHSDSPSCPGSDSDMEEELERALTNGSPTAGHMISSISETELGLTSDTSSRQSSHLTNSIEETSSLSSEQGLEAEAKQSCTPSPPSGQPYPGNTAQAKRLPPTELSLKVKPDDGVESFRRTFYLPVGHKLMPAEDNSECESESESEDDLSENSDSPWLLSNLVNKMISEGSYPISYPEECFKKAASETGSPLTDLEAEIFNGTSEGNAQRRKSNGDGWVDGSEEIATEHLGLRTGADLKDEKTRSECEVGLMESNNTGSELCLNLSNSTKDTISASLDQFSNRTSNPWAPESDQHRPRSVKNLKQVEVEPDNDLMMEMKRSGFLCLNKDGLSDKSDWMDGTGSLDYITETKSGLTVDLATALAYSPEDEGDSALQPDPRPPEGWRARLQDRSLAYDSVKYTLVVDENATLELVSLRRCTSVLSDDEDDDDDSEIFTPSDDSPPGAGRAFPPGGADPEPFHSSEDSSPEADVPFSKKFLNVFVNSASRSSSTESFGLFSCTVNGEERQQTHRAVFRFIPRHADELELDMDDPLFVEEEEDDHWYRGYNMRTGERGIFPAYYAHEVVGQVREVLGVKRDPTWVERFSVQFLGSVEVPCHQGNGILCAAMQKIAMARKQTVHVRPPVLCDLEVSLQGVKLVMTLEDTYGGLDEVDRCGHFFQMKNISFCGCHPKNNCYFGFITKHPLANRYACHVFVSQEPMRRVAECVGLAFQEYFQEHLDYACPTEDIYLE